MTEIRALSTLMQDLSSGLKGDSVSVRTLLEAFHERGFGVILLFFAAPMALPVPVPPGINILLATPLLLLTAQQMLGRHTIWLPEQIKDKTIDSQKLAALLAAIIPWLRRLEVLVRPRLAFITTDGASRLFGFFGVIMALTVCIPVPLTNTVPSLGIALMAIGVTMRDGLMVLAGALVGMAWVMMLVVAVTVFGPEAFDIVKETIKSFL